MKQERSFCIIMQNTYSMKYKRILSAVLCAAMLLATGCGSRNSQKTEPTEATYEVVSAAIGETANYGGMTLTVDFAEDPGVTLDNGNGVMLFHVTIVNETEETVAANYLNNFCLTVNGTFYDSYQCCTPPAMKVLYDVYQVEAINEEVAPHSTCEGYVACEVKPKYDLVELHYIPKTSETDRESRISVTLTENNIRKTAK